jgi:hypothetical protein
MDEKLILAAPEVSNWLKMQIEETKKRDICDCLNDIEFLRLVLESRLNKLQMKIT